MHALLSGLVLASISGLTLLAFRHPRAFARLYPYLNLAASVLFLVLSAWHVAVRVTWAAILPYVARDELPGAETAVAALTIPYAWACLAYIGLLALFWIDMRLPPFIKAAEDNDVLPKLKR